MNYGKIQVILKWAFLDEENLIVGGRISTMLYSVLEKNGIAQKLSNNLEQFQFNMEYIINQKEILIYVSMDGQKIL